MEASHERRRKIRLNKKQKTLEKKLRNPYDCNKRAVFRTNSQFSHSYKKRKRKRESEREREL